MKVNPYTSISYETSIEEVPTLVTVIKEVKKTKKVEKKVYEVELNQEQLDLIVAVCGNVVGGGNTRKITDDIYVGLQEYATKKDYNDGSLSIYKKYSFKDFFMVNTNQWNNLVTREEYSDEDEEE
jgi:hypothetical protein